MKKDRGDRHAPASAPNVHANRADLLWKENERIVKDALAGKTYSIEKFGAACAFFENVTGIAISGNGSFFGWLPDKDTEADFRKVEEWYALNRSNLYWDEGSKSVKVRTTRPRPK